MTTTTTLQHENSFLQNIISQLPSENVLFQDMTNYKIRLLNFYFEQYFLYPTIHNYSFGFLPIARDDAWYSFISQVSFTNIDNTKKYFNGSKVSIATDLREFFNITEKKFKKIIPRSDGLLISKNDLLNVFVEKINLFNNYEENKICSQHLRSEIYAKSNGQITYISMIDIKNITSDGIPNKNIKEDIELFFGQVSMAEINQVELLKTTKKIITGKGKKLKV